MSFLALIGDDVFWRPGKAGNRCKTDLWISQSPNIKRISSLGALTK